MPTLKGSYPFSINQSETGRTIFGLPGQGSGNSTYLNVDLDGTMKVYDDGSVRMDVSGRIWHSLLLSNDYPVILVVCPHDWDWTWNSEDANVPSGGHVISRAIVNPPAPGCATRPTSPRSPRWSNRRRCLRRSAAGSPRCTSTCTAA